MFLVLLIAIAFVSVGINASCDDGWSGGTADVDGACYMSNTEELDWFGSLGYCSGIRAGAFLAEIKSEEQQIYVRNMLMSEAPAHDGVDGVYLGGDDLVVEDMWVW